MARVIRRTKKIAWVSLVLTIVLAATPLLFASISAARPSLAALPQGAPLKTIQGTVKAEGDKITFVADEDGKSWNVMNPDVLKAHRGHHVEVSAHVYMDRNSIHVLSVKMVKKPG